jgi:hypothetical protein
VIDPLPKMPPASAMSPSGMTVTAVTAPLGMAVWTMPPSPKPGSMSPSGRNRSSMKSPPVSVTTTSLPSGWRVAAITLSSLRARPAKLTTPSPPPKAGSSWPLSPPTS